MKKTDSKIDMLKEVLLSDSESEEVPIQSQKAAALTVDRLHIKKGEFVGLIGKFGGGKSSLLAAVLGEIDKVQGTLKVRGTTAYISQDPWMRTATVKENILFETEYDEDKYQQVLELC